MNESTAAAAVTPGAQPAATADPAPSGTAAAATPAEHGFDFGRPIADDEKAFFDHFGSAMKTAGAQPAAVSAAVRWLDSVQDVELAPQKPTHPYNFKGTGFESPEDQKYLTAFGNALAAAGASEAEVYAMIRYWSDLQPLLAKAQVQEARRSAEEAHIVEQIDLEDRERGRRQLLSEWRESYSANVRAINVYLDSLPDARREEIEAEVGPDGVRGLNNPKRLNELLKEARSSSVPVAPDQVKAEIAAIEKLMRENRKAYNADTAKQARLRELYAMRG